MKLGQRDVRAGLAEVLMRNLLCSWLSSHPTLSHVPGELSSRWANPYTRRLSHLFDKLFSKGFITYLYKELIAHHLGHVKIICRPRSSCSGWACYRRRSQEPRFLFSPASVSSWLMETVATPDLSNLDDL